MSIKLDLKLTFTNCVGAIATLIGLFLMYLEVAGSDVVTITALGLVATKKINDMVVRRDA